MSTLNRAATFRAIVVNNADPEGRSRCQLHIPQVMGGVRSGWAMPIPAVGAEVPAVGDQVMITFEGADLTRPAYFAPTSSKVAQDALTLAQHAQSTADGAQATASSALAVGQTAGADAQTGIAKADTAQANATKALADAATAEKDAQTGITNAAAAQARADKGVADAATAEADAQKAITAAANAQTAADTGTVVTSRLRASTAARDASMLTQLAADLAPKIPDKTLTGGMLADGALNDLAASRLALSNPTINGIQMGNTGWIQFADAGITFVSGFAAYSTTCRLMVRNGVAYLSGTVQVTAAMTGGSASSVFNFATFSSNSQAASLFNGSTGYFAPFSFNSSAGGQGMLALAAAALQIGYRSVANLPTGYFSFAGSIPV